MFTTFTFLFSKIVLPIFILFAVGFVAQKKLKMDSRTFSRINMYVLVPCLLFVKIYHADVTLKFFGRILAFAMLMQGAMFVLSEIFGRRLKYSRGKRKAFSNALLFFNSGNYGIPLIDLAFKGSPLASSVQIFVMLIQNVTMNTFGVFQSSSGKSSYRDALKNVFMMPTLYVLAVVILIKAANIEVSETILTPLNYISQAFIAFATMTLGVQLAEIKAKFKLGDVLLPTCIRLILAPLIGVFLVNLLGVKGVMAQSMILGISMPTALNTAIIAKEFDNEPEYAAQVVLISTVISAITISMVLYFLREFFH